jgi:hypothetical protein
MISEKIFAEQLNAYFAARFIQEAALTAGAPANLSAASFWKY